MRSGKQPALTGPMEGHCELDLTIKPNRGADVGQTPLDYVQFPQGIELACQSHQNHYDNESSMILGSTHLDGSVISKTDTNMIDVRNDVYKFSEMSHPAANADYHKSHFGANSTPIRGETASNHLTRLNGPEDKTIRSQISGNFSNSRCMTSMLSHTENAIVKRNKNDMNTTALQYGHPGIAYESFLRLGIGGGIEARSNSNFSTQEISSKLKEVDSTPRHSYHVKRTAGDLLNLTQSMDRAARLQFNGGGLPNMVSRPYTFEGGGHITGTNFLTGSNPCSSSQKAKIQRNFSLSVDHGSGLQHDQNSFPLPLPYSRTSISHPKYASPSLSVSEVTKPTYFASQPMSVQQQSYCIESSINVSLESSSPSPTDWRRGNSMRHSQLRNFTLTDGRQTQVADSTPFLVSAEPLGHFNPAAQFRAQPQAFPLPYHRPLKRGVNEILTAACPNQRRRIVPGPIIHRSTPQQRNYVPAPISEAAQIPAAPFHIKFQGLYRPPKPCGYKCLLCKRDLSFTAEGSVYQPAAPPAVAVLPCGHTFHDSCLQMITPEEQAKHPTCIPCATGET